MRLFDNLYLASGTGNINTSQPIQMGENNAVTVASTMIVGSAGPALTVEGSNDLSNWSATGITGSLAPAAAPSFLSANFTTIAYAYVRVRLAGGAASVIINVDAHPQKF